MIPIKLILAGATFVIGPSAWLELHSNDPDQVKWKTVFDRYCDWKGWDKTHLEPSQQKEASLEADKVISDYKQENKN